MTRRGGLSSQPSLGTLTDALEEVMIFVVSLGVPTDSRGEVMKFGVSWGVPTDLGG